MDDLVVGVRYCFVDIVGATFDGEVVSKNGAISIKIRLSVAAAPYAVGQIVTLMLANIVSVA